MKSPLIVALLMVFTGVSAQTFAAESAAAYLTPAFHDGARYANVFSRAIAFDAVGFDGSVRRVSGSAIYRSVAGAAPHPRLQIDYHYDGLPPGSGTVEFRDDGATSCFNSKCTPNTDASGLAWNPRLWGTPPATLQIGQSWIVDIAAPWELGTPGRQKVTVVALDPASHRVTLKREGNGDGAYLDDPLKATLVRDGHSYSVTVQPGRSHWYGYTTFSAGVVVSDELMVERPVTLISGPLGHIAARQREYILLNAMPLQEDMAHEARRAEPPSKEARS
jgi:hypothetical protein